MPTPDDGGHWYDWQGQPHHTYINSKGDLSKTTLPIAKRENWVPSFSGICQVMAKPGLEKYKMMQMLYASLTLPQKPGESLDDYAQRVVADAEVHKEEAAATGTAIHAAIDKHMEDDLAEGHRYFETAKAAVDAIVSFHECDKGEIVSEFPFCHPMGWGGTCDQHSPLTDAPKVSDVKTKDFDEFDVMANCFKFAGMKPMEIARELRGSNEDLDDVRKRVAKSLSKLKLYEQHYMQLAAYREGLGLDDAEGAIIFVSTKVPGLVLTVKAEQLELDRGWRLFSTLFEFWKVLKGYDPREMKAKLKKEISS